MVWQSGRIEFFTFFKLFLPSVATYLVPALIMSIAVPRQYPDPIRDKLTMRRGAKRTIALGLLSIGLAVSYEQVLGIPPFMGMMTGLSLLMFLTYYLRRTRRPDEPDCNIFQHVRAVE